MSADRFGTEMVTAGRVVSTWANAPGEVYAPHAHPYRKYLCCLEGSIVFHTDDGDIALEPGDRLTLEPGVGHSATVGPDGVRCAEAHG